RVGPDLLGGGAPVHLGVRRVLELLGHEPAVLLDQLCRACDRALHAEVPGGELDACAVRGEQLAALEAHALGHREHGVVALGRRDHREPDPGVAAGRFDDRPALGQPPVPLGGLDHRERDAVLHAAAGVRALELRDETAGHPLSVAAQLYQRGPADQRGDVGVQCHHRPPISWFWSQAGCTSVASSTYPGCTRSPRSTRRRPFGATTIESGGTSSITTAWGPMRLRAPTVTGPSTDAPTPRVTPSSMVGWRFEPLRSAHHPCPPSVTPWYIITWSPTSAVSPMTTPAPWSMNTQRPMRAPGWISTPVTARTTWEISRGM